jgi:hypothetical protein
MIVLGVALAAIYLAQKAGKAVVETVKEVVPYVNPADERNVVNQGAEGLYQWATGSKGTPGGDFYDATHGGMLSDGTFNPTSNNNIINRGADSLWQWATGSKGTIGGDIYDWLH